MGFGEEAMKLGLIIGKFPIRIMLGATFCFFPKNIKVFPSTTVPDTYLGC